jgi:hypothetical protein
VVKEQTISIGKTIALKNKGLSTTLPILLAVDDVKLQIVAPKRLVGLYSFGASAINPKLMSTTNISLGNP